MKVPFFSVIMPVYNSAPYLEEAVNSIREQTFPDWELIMVDDGSTDICPEIIDRLKAADSRIRAVRQDNRGVSAATNHGLSLAHASWVCYLDNDDIWFKETLARYHGYIVEHPQAQFIYGYRHRLRGGKVTELKGLFQEHPTGPREVFEYSYLSPMRVCHSRALLTKVGGYDENLRCMQDYDFFLRVSMHTPLEPINYATGLRRRHGNNLSQQSGDNRLLEIAVLFRFLKTFGGEKVIPPAVISCHIGRIFHSAIREYVKAGYYKQAVDAYRQGSFYAMPWKTKLLQLAALLLLPWNKKDTGMPFPRLEPAPRCNSLHVNISRL